MLIQVGGAQVPPLKDYSTPIPVAYVDPIQPKYANIQDEPTFTTTTKSLPPIHKQNQTNDIFTHTFRQEFGKEADNRHTVAADNLNKLGTSDKTNEEIQKLHYQMARTNRINVSEETLNINITGLNQHLPDAHAQTEHVLSNAKADQKLYDQLVEHLLKARNDEKKEQRPCFSRACHYPPYGAHNPETNIMSEKALKSTAPQTLLNLLKTPPNIEHTVIHYSPHEQKKVAQLINKLHRTTKSLQPAPPNKPYLLKQTPQTEVFLAPYEAKNIYMSKLHNKGRQWTPNHAAVEALFNEYFGEA